MILKYRDAPSVKLKKGYAARKTGAVPFIIVGLCVGHDSLFMRYSDALCTVLVTKDRVTGHNPLAAINLHKSYYQKLREEKFNKGGTVHVTFEEDV